MPTNFFKKKYSLTERKEEAHRIIAKYPDRVPVIVSLEKNSKLPKLVKNRYLVPSDLTFGQFMYCIRKRIELEPSEALFAFVNNSIVPVSSLLSNVRNQYKDEDGFLYVVVNTENTFGL